MVKRAIVAAIGVLGMMLSGGASPRQGGPQDLARRIVQAVKHDVSLRLRDIHPLPPAFAHEPDEREPGPFRSLSGPPSRSVDTAVQTSPASIPAPQPSFTVEGVGNVNGVLPPDTNGDVGPNHYVQWVNLSFAVYAKGANGAPPTLVYGPAAGNTLWAGFGGPCEASNNGDPIVLYDHLADRWVMSQLAIPNLVFGFPLGPFYQCIAVSATPDPLGAYYRYQYQFDNLNDYPKLAVWPDAYYMTINEYAPYTLQFVGQGVVAFDRAAMLSGEPASMVFMDLSGVDPHLGGMLPADLDGQAPPAGAPAYFVQVDDNAWGYAATDQLQLWKFHVDWTNPAASTFTRAALLPTDPFDSDMCAYSRTCIAQPGTTAKVDAMADRLMYRLQYRNFGDHESLVVDHTVDVDGTDHAGIRWYELRDPSGAPFIYQQGTYAPDADNRWMASAALDASGNMAVGFSVSGPTTYPSIRYAGRLASDPPGVLTQGETTLAVGSGAQTHTSGRWGDYSMMTVDPTDDCTFWYTQEYYTQTTESSWQTRIGSFKFPECQTPTDLPAVSVTAGVSRVAESAAGPGTFVVSRDGSTDAPLTVTYSVSGSATPSVDYAALPGTLTIPAGAASATVAVTPLDDSVYEGDETVALTLAADPAYRPRSPLSAVVTIADNELPPDLVVTSAVVPPTGGAGLTIVVSDTTANAGSGTAGTSTSAFYLSKNRTYETTDVPLGTRAVPSLAPGVASSGATTITVPADTGTGTYYVVARADAENAVLESQESNNVASSGALLIGPDLVVSGLSAPTSAVPGGAIAVNETTANQGGGGASASTTRVYLSRNPYLDSSAVLIGSRSVGPLAPATSSGAVNTVTVPATTAAGTYYVLAKADADGVVSETQEYNNQRTSSPLKIGPDLVASVTAPSIGGAGATIVVSDKTTNQGSADAPVATTTTFYLSVNALLDASDTVLGSRPVGSLAAGALNSGTTTLTLPGTLASGTYFVFAQADSANAVVESSESNNASLGQAIRIGPDLVEAAVSAPGVAAPGGSLTVNDTTKNQGGGSAAASETRFYLSSNYLFDTSDIYLGSRPATALAAGAAQSASTVLTVPTTTPIGVYYVIAQADGGAAVAESVETNNTFTGSQVRVGPDLSVTRLGVPFQATAGSTITLTDTTTNSGAAAAGPSTTSFYLSANFGLDASDTLLASRSVPALAASTSNPGNVVVTLPAGLAPGTYYVLAKADSGGAVVESNETNNVSYALQLRIVSQ